MLQYSVDGAEQYIPRQATGALGMAHPEPSPRGEEHTPLVGVLTTSLLRTGLTLELVALILMVVVYLAVGGGGLFMYNLYEGGEGARVSASGHALIAALQAVYVIGAMNIACFQCFVADNSKFSRGLRAGSKYLGTAAVLDIVAGCLRLAQFIYAYKFMSLKWWARFQQTEAEWALLYVGNLLHAASLLLYGCGYYYTEVYHDEGVDEQFGWLCLVLFTISGASQFLYIFGGLAPLCTITLVLALLVATHWSFRFEPLYLRYAPALHSRDLNADVMAEGPVALTEAPPPPQPWAPPTLPSTFMPSMQMSQHL